MSIVRQSNAAPSPGRLSRAASARPQATLTTLPHRLGLGFVQAGDAQEVPLPRLAAAYHAVAVPNPYRSLVRFP